MPTAARPSSYCSCGHPRDGGKRQQRSEHHCGHSRSWSAQELGSPRPAEPHGQPHRVRRRAGAAHHVTRLDCHCMSCLLARERTRCFLGCPVFVLCGCAAGCLQCLAANVANRPAARRACAATLHPPALAPPAGPPCCPSLVIDAFSARPGAIQGLLGGQGGLHRVGGERPESWPQLGPLLPRSDRRSAHSAAHD